jgi:hypothetical protein
MEYLPFDRNRRQQSWADESGFANPVYLDGGDIREFQQRAVARRRQLTRGWRRKVNKARKRRRFSLERGVIRSNWGKERFAPFVVTRRRPDGNVALGSGIVDLGCLGLKDAMFEPSISPEMADEVVGAIGAIGERRERCSPELAAKILVHGVAYATRLGFEIPREYFPLRALLGGEVEEFPETPVPLGHNGKPVFVVGPYDDVAATRGHLEKKLGVNGYYFVTPVESNLPPRP